jgi:hypothetical protein
MDRVALPRSGRIRAVARTNRAVTRVPISMSRREPSWLCLLC